MLYTTEGERDYDGFERFNRKDTKITVIPTTAYIFFFRRSAFIRFSSKPNNIGI